MCFLGYSIHTYLRSLNILLNIMSKQAKDQCFCPPPPKIFISPWSGSSYLFQKISKAFISILHHTIMIPLLCHWIEIQNEWTTYNSPELLLIGWWCVIFTNTSVWFFYNNCITAGFRNSPIWLISEVSEIVNSTAVKLKKIMSLSQCIHCIHKRNVVALKVHIMQ